MTFSDGTYSSYEMRLAPEIILRKRNGHQLENSEIEFMVNEYTKGVVPDYQMSAFLMAIYFQGMSDRETWTLTQSMMHSGRVLDFSKLGIAVDKHSTGGVGDKTSLILAPIVACAGVPVPMIAGRGLGHTGGTIDKLETIPGFRCDLSIEKFQAQVETSGIALIGQTDEICPADKKIYALRDVTATIESLPLICASIMSKKMAEGIQGLVLDVKWGSGAFMKSIDQAKELAERLCAIGKAGGKNVVAMVTDMNQPLGRFIGNSLEVEECVAILKREGLRDRKIEEFSDCENLSVELAGAMIWLGGKAKTSEQGVRRAREILDSGAAYKKFLELVRLQSGDLSKLPKAQPVHDVLATASGVVESFDTASIGYAALMLGAGRQKTSDIIDATAGIEVFVRLGNTVKTGDLLFRLYGSKNLAAASDRLTTATSIAAPTSAAAHDKSLPRRVSNDLIAYRNY